MMLLASSSTARPALLASSSSSPSSSSRCSLSARAPRIVVGNAAARRRPPARPLNNNVAVASAADENNASTSSIEDPAAPAAGVPSVASVDKEVARLARSAATTFAPRASGATGKNPAYRGSTLYDIFGVQAWLSVAVGGLLSFNLIFPSDEPSIARLIGMWSIWMFTVPALRARECSAAEKDALNLLFLLIPLANVGIPVFVRSFPLVFSADVLLLFGVLAWKGAAPWQAQVEE